MTNALSSLSETSGQDNHLLQQVNVCPTHMSKLLSGLGRLNAPCAVLGNAHLKSKGRITYEADIPSCLVRSILRKFKKIASFKDEADS